jgi:hypothetical protein
MVRVSRRSWTPEQIEILLALVHKGISPARASVVLKRRQLAVQSKARQLGRPFPDVRGVRAAQRVRELEKLESLKRGEDPVAIRRSGDPGKADNAVSHSGAYEHIATLTIPMGSDAGTD